MFSFKSTLLQEANNIIVTRTVPSHALHRDSFPHPTLIFVCCLGLPNNMSSKRTSSSSNSSRVSWILFLRFSRVLLFNSFGLIHGALFMGLCSWGFIHFIDVTSFHFIIFHIAVLWIFHPNFSISIFIVHVDFHFNSFAKLCVICVLIVYLVNDSDNSVHLYTFLVICLLNDHQFFIRHHLTTRLNFDSDCQMIHIRANLLFSSIISAISHSDLLSSNLIDFASSFSFILACIAAISIASARRSLFLLVHSLISLMLVEFFLS